jgi:hypothetical protein
MQAQGNLHNDHHHKCSTYLQHFHLNIKYKKGSTNHVADCLIRPSVAVLTIVLNSYGHEIYGCPQLYNNESDFDTDYQTLSAGFFFPDFHLQDGLLCHLSHLCVPSCEYENLI